MKRAQGSIAWSTVAEGLERRELGAPLKKLPALVLVALAALIALGIAAPGASAVPNRTSGTPGNDIIRGTPGRDIIASFGGNDVIYGAGGADIIDAGSGNDTVRAQRGDDHVDGGDGRDIVYGGPGPDGLNGNGGGDILHTGDGVGGNDSADGGAGADICQGDRGDRHRSCSSSANSSNGGGGTGPGGEDVASGRCHMTGYIFFNNPLGAEPERASFTDYAEGTCTGTVNGEFLANERMYLVARGGGLLSCAATKASSTGTMVYTRNTRIRSDDVRIDYTAQSQGTAGQIVSRVRGRVSGEIFANVRFRGDEETLRQCEAGQLRRGVYDMDGQSVTPVVG